MEESMSDFQRRRMYEYFSRGLRINMTAICFNARAPIRIESTLLRVGIPA